jgi:hypothetical protein
MGQGIGGSNMVKQFFIEEVAKIQVGNSMMNDTSFAREGTPFISEKTLMKLIIEDDFSQVPRVDYTMDSLTMSQVPAKSILLNKINLKESSIYQCKKAVCIGQDIIAIIPNESIIVSDYLLHFLKWYQVNNDVCNVYHLMIELPPIDIQLHIAQLLNAIQHLLVNKDSLVKAIEGLPQYFNHISRQVKQHSNDLHYGFEQLQRQYIDMLHIFFNGDFLNDHFNVK